LGSEVELVQVGETSSESSAPSQHSRKGKDVQTRLPFISILSKGGYFLVWTAWGATSRRYDNITTSSIAMHFYG
jgi:hypothetical protein